MFSIEYCEIQRAAAMSYLYNAPEKHKLTRKEEFRALL